MELTLATNQGASVQLSETTFGREFNEHLVHQVVTAYMSGARQGTHAQKRRGEVSGGGKKPWKQKGSGRARSGSTRNPIWRGGGVTFAARTQDYSQKVNKKMYRVAMRSILSELLRQGRLSVVEDLSLAAPKTRELVTKLKDLGLKDVLIVIADDNANLYLAARNVHQVEVVEATLLDPLSLIAREKVLMTVGAVRQLEERLG